MMRNLLVLVMCMFFFGSNSWSQTEHFKRGYTTKNYDTLGTYNKMVGWDDSQYEQFTYFETLNATGPVLDFMNYRLIFPNNYDTTGNTKYPMVVMLHGAGESGRSWSGRYLYDPTDIRYDNNGHNVLWGGQPHRDAVNRDPSDPRAFPGFVLFPQVSHNGNWENGWNGGVLSPRNEKAVKIIEDLIDNFNVNPNKIYVHGLSNGAKGVWDIVTKRPDLFAAFLPMSGVGRDINAQTPIVTTMPLWQFQGGKDRNPLPNASEDWIGALVALGARPRYYLYPNLGHGTWNTAYAEPDFFSWMLDKDKRKIYVFGGSGETELCPGGQLIFGFSDGFLAYQWTKDGVDIPGETATRLIVNEIGTYAVKYQRRNGADSLLWDISFDLDVTPKLASTYIPLITVNGSIALPTPHKVGLRLKGPVGYSYYTWYKDGVEVQASSSDELIIVQSYSLGDDPSLAGSYTLVVLEPSGCESLVSDPVIVSHGNGPNAPIAPSNVLAFTVSASELDVTWEDNSNNEDYFEIWRAGFVPGAFIGWALVAIVNPDETSFHDSGLLPETKYGYKIRATNFDGGNISIEGNADRATTLPDLIPPSAPTDLIAVGIGQDTIAIAWGEGTDNISIERYNVYVNGDSIGNTSLPTFVIRNLMPSTSYNISVKSVDYSENKSAFASGLWLTTLESSPGLLYKIYTGTWSLLPDFTSLSPVSSGVISTFDISAKNATDNFAFAFDGYIEITTPGIYTFSTNSDDGSKLYIEGQEIVTNDGLHGPVTVSGNYSFPTAGKYGIRVTFFENGGGELLEVSYSGADTGNSNIIIPSSVLYLDGTPNTSIFYSNATGDLDLVSTWGSNGDGSGVPPSSFSDDFQQFIIDNRISSNLSNSWSVSGLSSKIIIANGETLSLDAPLIAMVELEDNTVLNINNAVVPKIGNCGQTSTVNINTNVTIPNGNFGNLNVLASQSVLDKTSTFVKGNLFVDPTSLVRGAPNNESEINVSGNITFNSSLSTLSSSELFTLFFSGAGNHTLNVLSENVGFSEIRADFGAIITYENNSASPTALNLGSTLGGGLTLESTSKLILGNVDLNIIGQGAINSGVESGVVSINGGNISVTSGAVLSSNIYLDNINNFANTLNLDLSGKGELTIFNGLNIGNKLKIVDGTLNVNNSLRLLSSNNFTAYIDVIENNGLIEGDMIMERHIRQGRYWRYFSSPFSGATVADWQKTIPITGNFDGANVLTGITSGASLYYYDETVGLDDGGWVAYPPNGGSNTAPIVSGVGYAMYIRANTSDTIFDMSGNPHQGDFNFSFTPDPSAATTDGWNLIGNPYASSIRWDVDGNGWSSSDINDIIYVRDNEDPTWWKWYDRSSGLGNLPNGDIAPGQAFYVRVISANPSLTVSETVKSAYQPLFYRSTSPHNYLSINLHAKGNTDVAYVVLRDDNDDKFEDAHDGVKKTNAIFNIATLSSDSVELSMNKLSSKFCSKIIPLSINGAEIGTYSLEINNLGSFDIPVIATLMDNLMEVEIDLSVQNTYNFSVSTDSLSFGNKRFAIQLLSPEVIPLKEIQIVNSCDAKSPEIVLDGTDENMLYQVFNGALPVSEVIMGSTQAQVGIELDSILLGFGTHELNVMGWYPSCGDKKILGNISIDYFNTQPEISLEDGLLISKDSIGNQWLFNGEEIEGGTNQNYRPTESGEYSLILTEGSCSVESSPIVFIITSVENAFAIDSFSIYPNPAGDIINVSFDSHITKGSLRIFNSKGMLMSELNIHSQSKNEISIQNYPMGLYLVQLVTPEGVFVSKFQKE